MTLLHAAIVLQAQALGQTPAATDLLAGALALDTLALTSEDRDIQDAAAGLRNLVSGIQMDLDQSGRDRAALLAEKVRSIFNATQTKKGQE